MKAARAQRLLDLATACNIDHCSTMDEKVGAVWRAMREASIEKARKIERQRQVRRMKANGRRT